MKEKQDNRKETGLKMDQGFTFDVTAVPHHRFHGPQVMVLNQEN